MKELNNKKIQLWATLRTPTIQELHCKRQNVGLQFKKCNAKLQMQAYSLRNALQNDKCRATVREMQCKRQNVGLQFEKCNAKRQM